MLYEVIYYIYTSIDGQYWVVLSGTLWPNEDILMGETIVLLAIEAISSDVLLKEVSMPLNRGGSPENVGNSVCLIVFADLRDLHGMPPYDIPMRKMFTDPGNW